MPRGIRIDKDILRDRIKELEAKILQIDRREKVLEEFKTWMTRHKLEPLDVLWMYRQMAPKRAAAPVKSRKPLKPNDKANGRAGGNGTGYFTEGGKLKPAKGDPEFRRLIRLKRVELGLSAETLGKKVGSSAATISSWEAGRFVPGEPKRVAILKALDLPPDLGKEATREMEAGMGRH